MSMRCLVSMVAFSAFAAQGANNAATPNRAPLQPNAFNPLPLGSVMPKGWLLDQLRFRPNGLSGHLDEFWPDLGPNSGWLGGSGRKLGARPIFPGRSGSAGVSHRRIRR